MSQDNQTYKELLRQKLDEYHRAEAEGKSRLYLLALYKEIKDLQLKVITSTTNYRFRAKSDNASFSNR